MAILVWFHDLCTEGLYALRKGTYVPSLNFRYGSFSFWGVGHVSVGILPIFMSLLPFHLSYVAVSRPCCLSEFYPSRAFRMGIGVYSGGERGAGKVRELPSHHYSIHLMNKLLINIRIWHAMIADADTVASKSAILKKLMVQNLCPWWLLIPQDAWFIQQSVILLPMHPASLTHKIPKGTK